MSRIHPAPDIKYLQDNLTQAGKKNLENEEFKKARLLSVAKKLAEHDFVQAEHIRADIEAYYNHYDNAINILKNLLKITNYQSLETWENLLKLYVETARIDTFIDSYKQLLQHDFKDLTALDTLFQYVIRTYLRIDLYDDELASKISASCKNDIDIRVALLKKSGIELPIYRKFMALFFQEFYAQYDGKTRPMYHYGENSLVIRMLTGIQQAEEIFEFNNHLQDQIMQWYAEANEEDQQQIEKVVIYIKNSSLITEKYEVAV